MKIKQFKKKCITLSLVLILAGSLISVAGFGVMGFRYNELKKSASTDAWYQTIHVNSNDYLWYGVKLGDHISLLSIGNIE